jgi:crotonobetainyl-CoA:carnitine CoA-transferase CaiB-like acyl-CoA transferase
MCAHYRPLAGLTVIEVSVLVAGPAMGSLLQELGANVIKIEQPKYGDPSRQVSPWGFLNYNYGKQSISLNLKSPIGQQILHRLVKSSDIFLENMGPDVAGRLGFSFDTLHSINPRLIYCSIKGFSKSSKHYNKPAFDAVAQAMSGTMSLTGEPGGEPLRIGNPSVDLGAASYAAILALAALLDLRRSGQGKYIEVPLLDMAVYWNGYWITYYGITKKIPQRLGSGHPGYCPHKVFLTKDSKYVLIAALNDDQWLKLSTALDLLPGESYKDSKFRLAHRPEVESELGKKVARLTLKELLSNLDEKVPCAPVFSISDIYRDADLNSRGVLRETQFEDRKIKIVESPVVLERSENRKKNRSGSYFSVPAVGKDTKKILRSINYSNSDIESFRRRGII